MGHTSCTILRGKHFLRPKWMLMRHKKTQKTLIVQDRNSDKCCKSCTVFLPTVQCSGLQSQEVFTERLTAFSITPEKASWISSCMHVKCASNSEPACNIGTQTSSQRVCLISDHLLTVLLPLDKMWQANDTLLWHNVLLKKCVCPLPYRV